MHDDLLQYLDITAIEMMNHEAALAFDYVLIHDLHSGEVKLDRIRQRYYLCEINIMLC